MSKSIPEEIDRKNIPKHIAVIMDGNGRWARDRNLPRIAGHREGAESVRDIIKTCGELGIRYLTLYAFSIENWQRPREEIQGLFGLLKKYLGENLAEIKKNKIRLHFIGELELLPGDIKKDLSKAREETRTNDGLHLCFALSYSGRREIVEAAKKISGEVKSGMLELSQVGEEEFSKYLYTVDFPDPDLLIRTSGEMRISNFLLWQIAYAEIWVTPVLWPDFRQEHLWQAVINYQERNRRYGRL